MKVLPDASARTARLRPASTGPGWHIGKRRELRSRLPYSSCSQSKINPPPFYKPYQPKYHASQRERRPRSFGLRYPSHLAALSAFSARV